MLQSRATRTFYDDFGRVQYTVQNVSDPQADIITLLANRTNEQNLISETRYDDYGRAFVTIDPLDRATRTYYDAQGRTQYVVRNCSDLAPGSQQPPDYDPLQPDRNVRTETIYDAAGRAIATRDTLGHTTRTYFDALDRSIRVVRNFASADLNILLPAYDPQHPDLYVRSETDYNAAGQVVATRDALGRETRTVYDDLGRLVPGATAALVVVPVEGLLDAGPRGARLAATRPLLTVIDGAVAYQAAGFHPDA